MATISRRTFLKRMAVGTGTIVWAATRLDFAYAAGPEAYQLRIVHTNDHHARIEPLTGSVTHGGVARRKAMIDAIRKEGGNQILIDAGDVFQGTLWFNQYNGLADLEFYNAMGYEAMAIGNHEFDKGQMPLADFIKGAKFPVLSANIEVAASSPLNGMIKPWIVKWIDGQPIGIFGLTTEETGILSSPGAGITFTNPIEAAKKAVAALRAQGVSKIIALTHIGITVDRELASKVDGIGVIIGGHSHTPMGPMVNPASANQPYPEVVASPSGNPVIIAHDWEWGRWLGDLMVGFDANGMITSVVAARPMEVAASIEPDKGFENRVNTLKEPLVALRSQNIGSTSVALNGARGDVRTKETNLGNLISDAMLAKTKPAGAQVALMNGGSIRTSIDAGPITRGEVLEVQPFGNTITLVTLTGAQIKEALENGVSQAETVAGRFPQVAGMHYAWNPSAAAGSRITAMHVGGKAIDMNASYRVVTNSFLLTGGDGYTVLTQGSNKVDTGFIDADVTAEYITANSPVNPAVEGRITQGTAPAHTPAAQPGMPAELPRTGGDVTSLWLLAALGAGAIGSGLRLRERGKRIAEPVAEEEKEAELV